MPDSPEIVTSPPTISRDSLPQNLPDKQHAPLVKPFGEQPTENGLGKTNSSDRSPWKRGGSGGVEYQPFNPSEDAVEKQIEKMRQAELAKSGDGKGVKDALNRAVLVLREDMIPPESVNVASTGVEARRREQQPQQLPDFQQLYTQRNEILDQNPPANDLTELVNRGDTARADQLREVEREMRQVFDSAVSTSGFAVDRNRDLTPEYIDELQASIDNLRNAQRGALDDNQANALRNYVENIELRVNGEPTDGLGWEFEPPTAEQRIDLIINSNLNPNASTFQTRAEQLVRLQARDPRNPPPGIDPAEWEVALRDGLEDVGGMVERLIADARRDGVMDYVVDASYGIFDAIERSKYGARTERSAEDLARELPMRVEENFWDPEDPRMQQLEQNYAGIGKYLVERLSRSIVKDIQQPDREMNFSDEGDILLEELRDKRTKIRERATSKERLNYNEYLRNYDFNWAENLDELRDSVFDWAEKLEEVISSSAVTESSEKYRQWKGGAEGVFEARVNALGLNDKGPEVKFLKDIINSYAEVITGTRLIEIGKEGFEGYAGNLETFMRESLRHLDAIVLSSEEVFIADDLITADGGKVYLAGGERTEKPSEGETRKHRREGIEAARRHATRHRAYITDVDFEAARLREVHDQIRTEATQRGQQRGLTPEQIEIDIERRLNASKRGEQRSGVYFNARYGWGENDAIEELLLTDQRGRDRAAQMPQADQAAEIAKVEARTGVFKEIKERWDKQEESIVYPGKTLHDLNPDERKEEIRKRIRDEIDNREYTAFGEEVDQIQDVAQRDKALWGWVKGINENTNKYGTIESGARPWFPTQWDLVRLSIDKSAKLRDRGLTDEQANAMIEKVDDPYLGMTTAQIRRQIRRQNAGLPQAQRLSEKALKDKTEQILFDKSKKEGRATRAVDILMKFHTFVGYEARAGGMQSREVDDDPNSPYYGETKMMRVYDELTDIMTAKIKAEEEWIEGQVTWYDNGINSSAQTAMTPAQIEVEITNSRQAIIGQGRSEEEADLCMAAYRNGLEAPLRHKESLTSWYDQGTQRTMTPAEIQAEIAAQSERLMSLGKSKEEIAPWMAAYRNGLEGAGLPNTDLTPELIELGVKLKRRSLRRGTTFALTHAAKEMGLTEGHLPIWSPYYYGDEKLIDAMAPYYGYTHEDKGTITQIVDKGRRELRAIKRYVAQKHMGTLDHDYEEEEDDGHGHQHTVHKSETLRLMSVSDNPLIGFHDEKAVRPRVINIGGALRGIYEQQMMVSTSGGVNVPERAVEFGDLGVNDLFLEMGAMNLREFWRWVKRRDEAELADQSHWALGRDEKEHKDGVSYAKRLRGSGDAATALTGGKYDGRKIEGILNEPMSGAYKYRDMFFDTSIWLRDTTRKDMGHITHALPVSAQELAEWKKHIMHILDEAKLKEINPVQIDKLIEVGFGIMKPLVDLMDARKYVENRGGKAPRTWAMDNELIFKDYISLLLDRDFVQAKDDSGKILKDEKGNIIYENGGVKENLGPKSMAYAVHARTPMAIKLFTDILRTSSYHLLKEKHLEKLVEGGKDPDSQEVMEGAKKVKERMDAKRKEIKERMDSDAEFAALLDKRAEVFKSRNATKGAIDKEQRRMKFFYVEDRLHKEFFGEWPAMYAEVMDAPVAPHPQGAAAH